MIISKIYLGLTTKDGAPLNPEHVKSDIILRVPAGTIYHGTGIWKGVPEDSLIIEQWDVKTPDLYKLAKYLQTVYNQKAVTITQSEHTISMIGG